MDEKKRELKRSMEELTRRSILEAAATLLNEHSVREVTMDKIAMAAGVAKGTLYLYFKSKDALLNELVFFCYEPLEFAHKEIAVSELGAVEKLEKLFISALKFIDERKKLFLMLEGYVLQSHFKYISDKTSWYWGVVDLFSSILNEGIAAGEIRSLPVERAAIMLFETIDTAVAHRIIHHTDEDAESVAREYADVFVNGIRAR